MSILRHFEASSAERMAYLKMSRAVRGEGESEDIAVEGEPEESAAGELSQERYAQMSAAEEFVLTVSQNGYGKRSSSYEYRTTRRGGKGIVAMAVNERNGRLVASFPVEHNDQIMMVSDGGQIIRMPIDDIRIIGRGTQGVIVFDTAEDEKVVSVEHLAEEETNGEEGNGDAPDDSAGGGSLA
jgi:DNA gyrase subunit A